MEMKDAKEVETMEDTIDGLTRLVNLTSACLMEAAVR